MTFICGRNVERRFFWFVSVCILCFFGGHGHAHAAGAIAFKLNAVISIQVGNICDFADLDNEYKNKSVDTIITKLGLPTRVEQYAMGDVAGEYYIELQNDYPTNDGKNNDVPILEMAWEESECHVVVWLHQVDGESSTYKTSESDSNENTASGTLITVYDENLQIREVNRKELDKIKIADISKADESSRHRAEMAYAKLQRYKIKLQRFRKNFYEKHQATLPPNKKWAGLQAMQYPEGAEF